MELPHSLESEQGLLGCLLLDDAACWPEIDRAGVSPRWFHDGRHAEFFSIAREIREKGRRADVQAIWDRLKELGRPHENCTLLAALPNAGPTASNLGYHLEPLREKFIRRVAIQNAERVKQAALNGADLDEVLSLSEGMANYAQRERQSLPEIVDAADLAAIKDEDAPELVYGLLHRGSKLVLGGGSKSFKTWALLDLAESVAYGEPWLGFKTAKSRVLYLNLEIQGGFFKRRIDAVASAKYLQIERGQLDVWTLRGYSASYDQLLPQIKRRIAQQGYGLVILDPIYKILGDLEENSAGDIGKLLNEIERLATETGAAVAFGAHFSKGNQAGKEAIDRISGSGVFARDPDSILVLTRHEQDRAFTVESILRNFKPVEPFVIRWDYPLFRRDSSLDPAKLKKASSGGRKPIHSAEKLLAILGGKSLAAGAWFRKAADKTGIGKSRFYEMLGEMEQGGQIKQNKEGEWLSANCP